MKTIEKIDKEIEKQIQEAGSHKAKALKADNLIAIRSEKTRSEMATLTAEILLEIRDDLIKKKMHLGG